MNLNDIAFEAFNNSKKHGFWDGDYDLAKMPIDVIGLKLALIHSEVSEALEDARKGNMVTVTEMATTREFGKPHGFPSELADVIIRIGDLAGALGIDLDHEVKKKMAYNAGRPRMHGKLA